MLGKGAFYRGGVFRHVSKSPYRGLLSNPIEGGTLVGGIGCLSERSLVHLAVSLALMTVTSAVGKQIISIRILKHVPPFNIVVNLMHL